MNFTRKRKAQQVLDIEHETQNLSRTNREYIKSAIVTQILYRIRVWCLSLNQQLNEI